MKLRLRFSFFMRIARENSLDLANYRHSQKLFFLLEIQFSHVSKEDSNSIFWLFDICLKMCLHRFFFLIILFLVALSTRWISSFNIRSLKSASLRRSFSVRICDRRSILFFFLRAHFSSVVLSSQSSRRECRVFNSFIDAFRISIIIFNWVYWITR